MVQELESKGVVIKITASKLTDQKSMQALIGVIQSEMGEIGGIVHSAGVVINNNPAFYKKDYQDIQKTFEPKVEAIHVLDQVLSNQKLDFFIIFSSVSGVFPQLGVGVSDYAIANAYLDQLVEQKHREGKTYYQSISWGSWKETGMGEVDNLRYKNLGLISNTNEEGISLFEKVFQKLNQENHLIALVCDENQFEIEQVLKQQPQNKVFYGKTLEKEDTKQLDFKKIFS